MVCDGRWEGRREGRGLINMTDWLITRVVSFNGHKNKVVYDHFNGLGHSQYTIRTIWVSPLVADLPPDSSNTDTDKHLIIYGQPNFLLY